MEFEFWEFDEIVIMEGSEIYWPLTGTIEYYDDKPFKLDNLCTRIVDLHY